jgi:hypothetical protein
MANVTSRAFLKCRAAENKSREASDWWTPSIEHSRGYLARKTPGFGPELHHVRKVLASQYYQLMMGHAVIAPYLKYKIKTSDSDTYWWCDIEIRQSREHLFKEYLRWRQEIKELWSRVQRDVGWGSIVGNRFRLYSMKGRLQERSWSFQRSWWWAR